MRYRSLRSICLAGWSPRLPTRFLVSRGTLDPALPLPVSLTGLSPSLAGFPKAVLLAFPNHFRGPNPGAHAPRFGLLRVRSPLLTESLVVFSSSGYLDVSVRRVPLPALWIGAGMHEGFSCGFPHSDTSGSKGICPSPKLFAAYRVFRRLLVPRHPPYALSSMTKRTAAHGRRSSPTSA